MFAIWLAISMIVTAVGDESVSFLYYCIYSSGLLCGRHRVDLIVAYPEIIEYWEYMGMEVIPSGSRIHIDSCPLVHWVE